MSIQRGRNSGVTGLVDISGTPKFTVRVYSFQQVLNVNKAGRQGRSQGRWSKSRPYTPGGQLILTGTMQAATPPLPSSFQGEAGSIVLQPATGATVTVAVIVDSATVSFDEKREDTWKVGLTCTITAMPVSAGFTNAAPTAAADPATTTVELYEGTAKTHDPDGLQTSSTRVYDVWGAIADDDATEWGLITTALTNAVPLSGQKARSATVSRSDSHGARISIQYALTTTGEDVLKQNTRLTVDPDNLTKEATTAAWTGTPATPSGSGWVQTGTQTVLFNDSKTLTIYTWGTRTAKQGIEYEGTAATTDSGGGILDRSTITTVTTNATESAPATPPGLALYSYTPQRINSLNYRHVWEFRPANSATAIEWEGSEPEYDPETINDQETITVTSTTTTPPSTPSATLGSVKLVRRNGPRKVGYARYVWRFIFAQASAIDRIEADGTVTKTDPQVLEQLATITEVTASATPSAPAAPTNTVYAFTDTQQIPGTSKYTHRHHYAPFNTKERIEADTVANYSVSVGQSETATVSVVDSSDSPDTYGAAQFAIERAASAWFRRLSVRKAAPGKLVKVVHMGRAAHVFEGRSFDGTRWQPGIIDTGSVNVLLAAKFSRGTGMSVILINPIKVFSQQARIDLLTIRQTASGFAFQSYESRIGTTNSSTFLNRPAGTVKYLGAITNANLNLSVPRWDPISYQFLYDSAGHADMFGLNTGWFTTAIDLSAYSPGDLVPASVLTDIGFDNSSVAATSDFSVFIP